MPDQITVTSADGTVLGAFVEGSGPPLLLVHGSTADHHRWAPLVPLLRDEFTLVMLDRRGRGASAGEGLDYAIEREGEDVLAALAALPEPAMIFGHSYGASCVLGALDRLPPSSAVLLYEPAFATPGEPAFTEDQLMRWNAVLAEGRREELLEMFYREALLFDDDAVDAVRALPMWPHRVAAVHTVVREAQAVREFAPAASSPSMPVRFLVGEVTSPMLAASTRAAAAAVAGSELCSLAGQGHVAIDTAPELVAEHVRATWARREAG